MRNKFGLSFMLLGALAPMIAFNAAGEGNGGGGADPAAGAGAGDAPAGGGDLSKLAGGVDFTTPEPNAAGSEGGKQDEGNPEGGEKKEGEGNGDGDEGATEFALEVPEGLEAFQGDFSAYTGAANEFLKANPTATASDALKWAAEHQAERVKAMGGEMRERFESNIKKWEGELLTDPRIGNGDQAKMDAELQDYYAGLRAVGSPELVQVLNESGLGSHKEIFAAFAKVGKKAKESPVLAGEGGKGQVSFASGLYGKKG